MSHDRGTRMPELEEPKPSDSGQSDSGYPRPCDGCQEPIEKPTRVWAMVEQEAGAMAMFCERCAENGVSEQ